MAYRCSLACSAAETEGGSTQEILNIREKCQTSAALNWFFLPCILPFRGIIALMLVDAIISEEQLMQITTLKKTASICI